MLTNSTAEINDSDVNLTTINTTQGLTNQTLIVRFNSDISDMTNVSICSNYTCYGKPIARGMNDVPAEIYFPAAIETPPLSYLNSRNDGIAPNVTLLSPASGTDYSYFSSYNVNFTFNVTDNFAINNCTVRINGTAYVNQTNASAISLGVNNTINVTLNAGSYSAYADCIDEYGNTGNSSAISFTITAPASQTTSGSSISSGGSAVFTATKEELEKGYEKSIIKGQEVKFYVSHEQHSLKISEVDLRTVTVIISSKTQQKTLSIGEEWKVELTNDSYYDLSVRLNNISNKNADVIIKTINESVIKELINGGNESTIGLSETQPKEEIPKSNYSIRFIAIISASIVVLLALITLLVLIKRRSRS